jgi:hypothetical protein
MPPVIGFIGPLIASLASSVGTGLAAIGGGSALAGAATAGGLALGGTELVKGLTQSTPTASPFPTPTQVTQDKNALASTVQQNLGNLQEEGSGGLSPNYLAEAIGSGTGNLNSINELQDLINGYGGSGGGGGGSGGVPAPNLAQLAIPSQPNQTLSSGQGLTQDNIFGG